VNRQFKADRPNQLWVSDSTSPPPSRGQALRLHLAGLRLCRLRHRCLCPPHRRLARRPRYDNALAETINGLFKTEVIHRKTWKTCEAVELATLEWVDWSNHRRLLEPIGYIPPAEAEAHYWQQQNRQALQVA
jgi:transposase InsO family protein